MTEKMLEQLTLDSLKKLGYSIENVRIFLEIISLL